MFKPLTIENRGTCMYSFRRLSAPSSSPLHSISPFIPLPLRTTPENNPLFHCPPISPFPFHNTKRQTSPTRGPYQLKFPTSTSSPNPPNLSPPSIPEVHRRKKDNVTSRMAHVTSSVRWWCFACPLPPLKCVLRRATRISNSAAAIRNETKWQQRSNRRFLDTSWSLLCPRVAATLSALFGWIEGATGHLLRLRNRKRLFWALWSLKATPVVGRGEVAGWLAVGY